MAKVLLCLTAFVVCFLSIEIPLPAQSNSSIGISITPEAQLPIGSKSSNYKTGAGARIEGLLGFSENFFFTPILDAGAAFIPLDLAEDGFLSSTNLTLLHCGLGVKTSIGIGDRTSLFARAHASGYLAALIGESTGNAGGLAFGGGGGLSFLLSPTSQIELCSAYNSYTDLYEGLSLSLGVTMRLFGPGNRAIPRADFAPSGAGPVSDYIYFSSVELDRVFPVLYKYYDDHPMGKATIINQGKKPVENIEIRLSLKQFMDAPKVSARIDKLEPNQEKEIDIYALFNEQILNVTEGAKLAAEIRADYKLSGGAGWSGTDQEVVTLETYNRNAMRWDDDRKIAAFVTAWDEEIQRFARNNASVVDDYGIDAIARELQLAMVFLHAMDLHHCVYVVDPTSAYFEMSRDADAIDSVQFPRQTLQFKAGDCDDLSATFAALMEASGVYTAFITVPGHIYTAFKLGMSRQEAMRTFSRPQDLIVMDDETVWLPVETTLLRDGFLTAWIEGASQWRKYHALDKAELIETEKAWQHYEPVAFGVSDFEIDIPLRDDVVKDFSDELEKYINREISGREQDLIGKIRLRPSDTSLRNSLGVLYARYGKYTEAEEQFRAAVKVRDYVPGLINLGNIAFLRKNYSVAREAFQKAIELDNDNRTALLGLARTSYAEGDYRVAQDTHQQLQSQAPELAERFSYLSSGSSGTGRAADAALLHSVVVWEEEPK